MTKLIENFFSLNTKLLKKSLKKAREKMTRIFYRSIYTNRFKKWLELCAKAGLYNELISANKLCEAIQESKRTQQI